jgi:membrane-associated protease RseP (regulator of RpoE activity)
MARHFSGLLLLFLLGAPGALAQSSKDVSTGKTKSGTFLGLHLGAIPEVLYEHLPALQRGEGILVQEVKRSSPADKAGLKRHDLILSYNGTNLKTTEQLVTLIRSDKPERKAALLVIRSGKEVTLGVNLVEACKLAEASAARDPRGNAKYGRPPAVSVMATTLDAGKMQVTFAYVPEGKTKERRVTFSGSLDQIERQVQDLPSPVQDLAKVAIDRLRNRKSR